MAKRFEIRNSTAEFLIFAAEGREQGIQVLYKNETIWATQKGNGNAFLTAQGQHRIASEEHIRC